MTVGLKALILEDRWAVCYRAIVGIGVSVAIQLSLKGSTGTLASIHFQFSREPTILIDFEFRAVHCPPTILIDFACRGNALSIDRIDGKRIVEAIYQKDMVVLVTLVVVGQHGGNGSQDLAAHWLLQSLV